MAKIKTSIGDIHYTIRPLYLGIKRIDKTISLENLMLFKSIADKNGIKFGLIAGTLLGAVREKDFISHDEDTDLFLYEKDKEYFLSKLPFFLNEGFEIVRYDRRGLISIMKNGEYIDLYFFTELENNVSNCCGWLIPTTFLKNTGIIKFKNIEFYAPKNYIDYLVYEYGNSWSTPIPYTDFNVAKWKIILFKWKEIIKTYLPDTLFYLFANKTEKEIQKTYFNKLDIYFKNNQ